MKGLEGAKMYHKKSHMARVPGRPAKHFVMLGGRNHRGSRMHQLISYRNDQPGVRVSLPDKFENSYVAGYDRSFSAAVTGMTNIHVMKPSSSSTQVERGGDDWRVSSARILI